MNKQQLKTILKCHLAYLAFNSIALVLAMFASSWANNTSHWSAEGWIGLKYTLIMVKACVAISTCMFSMCYNEKSK